MTLYRMCFLFFLLLVATLCQSAEAAGCPAEVRDTVSQHWQLAHFNTEPNGKIRAEVCKVWPYDEQLLLSAFAYDVGEKDKLTLVVSVYQREQKQLLNTYEYPLAENALVKIGAQSLSLDTARYDVATGVRAFGVRIATAAKRPADAKFWYDDNLVLFVREGDSLKPVFRAPMEEMALCDDCDSDAPRWKVKRGSLSLLPDTVHDYHRLCLKYRKLTMEGERIVDDAGFGKDCDGIYDFDDNKYVNNGKYVGFYKSIDTYIKQFVKGGIYCEASVDIGSKLCRFLYGGHVDNNVYGFWGADYRIRFFIAVKDTDGYRIYESNEFRYSGRSDGLESQGGNEFSVRFQSGGYVEFGTEDYGFSLIDSDWLVDGVDFSSMSSCSTDGIDEVGEGTSYAVHFSHEYKVWVGKRENCVSVGPSQKSIIPPRIRLEDFEPDSSYFRPDYYGISDY